MENPFDESAVLAVILGDAAVVVSYWSWALEREECANRSVRMTTEAFYLQYRLKNTRVQRSNELTIYNISALDVTRAQ